MKIAVIGATGMVGSRVVAEARARGHEVVAGSRSGSRQDGGFDVDVADTAAVARVIEDNDITVLAVPPVRTGDVDVTAIRRSHQALIAAAPQGRFIVVGGAGALQLPDGSLLKDSAEFPAEYKAESDVFGDILEDYRASQGLAWTMLAPAPMIAPGERTGAYKTETDIPAGETVSAEDFAVALVDEAESGAHRGTRFTVAN